MIYSICVELFLALPLDMYGTLTRQYLPVVRAIKHTFSRDPTAERQVIAAVRMSIAEMMNNHVSVQDIAKELEATAKMLRLNIAQVRYNEKIDSYSVKLTEDMVPKDGCVVDIQTPGEVAAEETRDHLKDVVGHHCAK